MTDWEKKVLAVATLYDADADRIERALHALNATEPNDMAATALLISQKPEAYTSGFMRLAKVVKAVIGGHG